MKTRTKNRIGYAMMAVLVIGIIGIIQLDVALYLLLGMLMGGCMLIWIGVATWLMDEEPLP